MVDELPQTIDVWSFGTVLLTAATWVVFGHKGIEHFELVRKVAIAELKASRASDNGLPTSNRAFHDGKDLLPEIAIWCNHIEDSARKFDTVTAHILHLVQESLLLANAEARLTCSKLKERLTEILECAKPKYTQLIKDGHLCGTNGRFSRTALQAIYLHELDIGTRHTDTEAAEKTVTVDAEINNEKVSLHIPLQSSAHKSNRAGKSKRMGNTPMPKTSNLEEGLRSRLGIQLANIPETVREQGSRLSQRYGESHPQGHPPSKEHSPRGALRRSPAAGDVEASVDDGNASKYSTTAAPHPEPLLQQPKVTSTRNLNTRSPERAPSKQPLMEANLWNRDPPAISFNSETQHIPQEASHGDQVATRGPGGPASQGGPSISHASAGGAAHVERSSPPKVSGLGLPGGLSQSEQDVSSSSGYDTTYQPSRRPDELSFKRVYSPTDAMSNPSPSATTSSPMIARTSIQNLKEIKYPIIRARLELEAAEQEKSKLRRTFRFGREKAQQNFQKFCENRDIVKF